MYKNLICMYSSLKEVGTTHYFSSEPNHSAVVMRIRTHIHEHTHYKSHSVVETLAYTNKHMAVLFWISQRADVLSIKHARSMRNGCYNSRVHFRVHSTTTDRIMCLD